MSEVVFSAMRPTGKLHLGHLSGALINWVKLQDTHKCFYGIVDWHALMSDYSDSSCLKENCREILLDWLASGVDPEKSVMFLQSHVPQHAELHLALSMITPLGWLERCPTYKDQILNLQNKDLSTYAFLGYPVLMASDILLYKATRVPVGEDQAAHLEISREMARRFNQFFGPIFPEPGALYTPSPKMPGTDGRKMSKSYNNSLNISDDAKTMWKKLSTMTTDTARYKKTDPGEPDKCPVWDLQKFFNKNEGEKQELALGCRGGAIGCLECKKKLAAHMEEYLAPIQERRKTYENKDSELREILDMGAKKAREAASATMDEVRRAIGFI